MKFEDTKLPGDKLVEDAFNYAQDYNKALAPELLAQFKQQVESRYATDLLFLNEDKEAGQIDEDKYNASKSRLDMVKEAQLKQLPRIVDQQLENIFTTAKLGPVQEISNHSDNATPALLAATMLVDCVRDPVDYKKVEGTFGGAVGGLIAEILHIDSYPGTLLASLSDASADAKRIFMAGMSSSLNTVAEQVKKLPPGQMLRFPPKQEETMFSQAKVIWGNDKKQDARLTDVFNKAAEAMNSNYRLELTAAGAPDLVESIRKAPPKMLPGPKKPPKAGDDGF
jgi:hypothetical protein